MHHFHAQGTAMFRRGDYERLLEMERACVEHARRAGDARFAAFHVTNIGFALAQLGDFEDALDLLTAARIEALHHKLGTGVLVIDQNMGYVLMLLGRLDEAREIEEQVVEDAEGKIPRIRAIACACLARIHLRQGSAHAAIAAAERAVQAAPTDTPRVYGYACLAEAQLAAGMPDKAIESSGKALDLARGIGGCTVGDIIAGRAAVEALVALGQKSEAARALETPLAMVQSRAAMVRTPRWRKGMLERVEDNRAILELADKLLGARALGA
jgi:tetratricopeptide (TPR) repeat protein